MPIYHNTRWIVYQMSSQNIGCRSFEAFHRHSGEIVTLTIHPWLAITRTAGGPRVPQAIYDAIYRHCGI